MTTTVMTSSLHANYLKTVATNGAYTASRALSKWFRKGVRVMTEGFERIPIHQLADAAGPADESVVALHTGITGDLRGHVLLVMSDHVAGSVAGLLTENNLPDSATFPSPMMLAPAMPRTFR